MQLSGHVRLVLIRRLHSFYQLAFWDPSPLVIVRRALLCMGEIKFHSHYAETILKLSPMRPLVALGI